MFFLEKREMMSTTVHRRHDVCIPNLDNSVDDLRVPKAPVLDLIWPTFLWLWGFILTKDNRMIKIMNREVSSTIGMVGI